MAYTQLAVGAGLPALGRPPVHTASFFLSCDFDSNRITEKEVRGPSVPKRSTTAWALWGSENK